MKNEKIFLFRTQATMKPYNYKKWWIDDNIIPQKTFYAENEREAIAKYINFCENNGVIISKTAIKNAQNMYIDGKEGEPQKVGKIFTAKYAFFDEDTRKFKNKFIELWTDIAIISYDF